MNKHDLKIIVDIIEKDADRTTDRMERAETLLALLHTYLRELNKSNKGCQRLVRRVKRLKEERKFYLGVNDSQNRIINDLKSSLNSFLETPSIDRCVGTGTIARAKGLVGT